jgi:hypothetical protein
MKGVKLVNLGLPKSGTSTLSRALWEAGWKAADHKIRRGRPHPSRLVGSFVAEHLYRGYFDTGNPFKYLGYYDALTEVSVQNAALSLWPQCDYAMVRAMRLARRRVLFVATWREPEEIADSIMRWRNLGSERLPAGHIPGLPAGWGETEAQRLRWITGHYTMLLEVFAGDPRFLMLPVAARDARARLARFIGRDLPWWGRENANADNPAEAED